MLVRLRLQEQCRKLWPGLSGNWVKQSQKSSCQMSDSSGVSKIPLQVLRGCIVASIQIDLSGEVLRQFQKDLLALLQSTGATGVILEVSGVEILDLEDFNALRRTTQMAAIMGARTIMVGLQSGVVSSLVTLGADIEEIHGALSFEDAFLRMGRLGS